MIKKTKELLNTSLDHEAMLPYPIEESVKKMMALFDI
jgi:hypothetical protein